MSIYTNTLRNSKDIEKFFEKMNSSILESDKIKNNLENTPQLIWEISSSLKCKKTSEITKMDKKTEIDDLFVNNGNLENVAKLVWDITFKVLKCLMDKKAIINSNIDFKEIKSSFEFKKFPENWNRKLDFVNDVTEKWPVINSWSPNYIWQMLPALNIPAIIANHIATILNQNLIAEEVAPIFTQMENQVIWYLSDIIGYNKEESGWSITSWWTIANLTAMLVTRNTILKWAEEKWIQKALEEYNKDNKTTYEDIELFVWEDAHYSIEKLAWYVWIWSEKIKKIPYDRWFELDTKFLKSEIEKSEKNKKLILWIFITAWTTEKWHIHDIDWVVNVAKNIWQNWRKIYVHVDAAHWGWFLVDEKIKEEYFKSIKEADSVTIDGHKMFYTNYSCWWIIFKDKKSLNKIKHSAKYIISNDSLNENHWAYTIEWSRWTWWVFQLWSSIKSFWKDWYKKLVNKTIENTQLFKKLLEQTKDFEVLSWDSPLNLICFRFHPEGINDENELNSINVNLKKILFKDWEYYAWDTEIDDKKCFRSVFMNYNITESDLAWFIKKIRELYESIKI